MKRKIGILLVLCAVISGCASQPFEERVDDVVRVFWHERGRYSFHIQKDSSSEIEVYPADSGTIKIIADVPTDQKMWMYVRGYSDGGWSCTGYNGEHHGRCYGVFEIHVHSEQDIEGGGWNHGKFGSGNTVVIR